MIGEAVSRRALLVAAAICLAVAALVAVGVIPPVGTDPHHRATSGRAVNAFIVMVILHTLLSGWLLALVRRRGGYPGKVQPGAVGLLALIFGLLLLDAASAFAGHGPGLRAATVALYSCAGADLVAGVLAFAAGLIGDRSLPKVDVFSST